MLRILFLLLFVLLSASKIDASTIHALLVGDTLEYTVGLSARRDCEKISSELEKIARYSGMDLKTHLLVGRNATPHRLLQTLEKIKPSVKDTFVFYFSGHGYHYEGEAGSRWPSLYFCLTDRALPLQQVIDRVVEKNPRFALIISDSCNNYVDEEIVGDIVFRKSVISNPVKTYENINGYKKLFLKSKGLLIATAAMEGGYAEGTDEGSSYTKAFLSALHDSVNEGGKTSWVEVMLKLNQKLQEDKLPLSDFHYESDIK